MKIKGIISEIKKNAEMDKIYTLEDIFKECMDGVNDIKDDVKKLNSKTLLELAQFYLITDKKLKEYKEKIFKKCAETKGIIESQEAFSMYRSFLEIYKNVMTVYNNSILENMPSNIQDITKNIFEIQKNLLPINNDNLDKHTEYHFHNEPHYKEIEKLEKQRRRLLYEIINN